jgi:BioD-like phosphotransacetylase family protein
MMKSIYITSVERYSGKTATCLALGRSFQADGYTVGYLKPLSLQPWRIGGRIVDEDAAFVKEILGLSAPAWDLSPVVLTPEFLSQHLVQRADINLLPHVQNAVKAAGEGKDILLLEGGASMREGYVVGLPTPAVAAALGSAILAVIKYRDQVRLLDDALAAQVRMQTMLAGILINRVPTDAQDFVTQAAIPFLESHGIQVFGALPEKRSLEALTVDELIQALNADVLTPTTDRQALVETLTVGAMTADAALSRFRQQMNKAVITGGDRTDIQLAALETSTACLVLTGNLQPSQLIVRQAEEFGVSVLLVPTNTMETIEAIEKVFGKTHLGQPAKLQQFQDLMAEHLDLDRLYRALGLK